MQLGAASPAGIVLPDGSPWYAYAIVIAIGADQVPVDLVRAEQRAASRTVVRLLSGRVMRLL